jgi:hypothetical protein
MKLTSSQYPLVRLPANVDLTLFLIREELKSERFFNGLHDIGIDECLYQTHLGKLVLASVGLDDDRDETFQFYYKLIEKRSSKIGTDNDSIMKQAFKVYMELMIEKDRRKDR